MERTTTANNNKKNKEGKQRTYVQGKGRRIKTTHKDAQHTTVSQNRE